MENDIFDAMLDMNDPDFATKLMQAIGLNPGDSVRIMAPQFDRTDGLTVPKPLMDFSKLSNMPAETLTQIGCQKWSDPDKEGNVLWLYPAEWYDHIPDGTPIVTISDRHEIFKRGETDNDRRFGALSYGFLAKARGESDGRVMPQQSNNHNQGE